MKREAVDVQLPNHKATFIQLAALLMTRVQIRSIAFAAPGATGCRDPCTLSELAAAEVATSPAALAASKRTLEVRTWEHGLHFTGHLHFFSA